MTKELKPTIELVPVELVPAPQWYQSLKRKAKKSALKGIRNEVIARQEGRCAVCGALAGSRLQCYEVWEYGEKQLVQKFKGFVGLCVICHHVKTCGVVLVKVSE